MKFGILISCIVAGVLAIVFFVMAGERYVASGSTSQAIEVINRGLDWDETTPISAEQQADRMEANLDVLGRQESQRNMWAGLGMLTTLTLFGSVFMLKIRSATAGHETPVGVPQ